MNPLYIAALALVVTAGTVAVLCAAAVTFTLAAIHRARLARDLRRSAVVDAFKHPLVSAGEVAHRGVCLEDPMYDAARGATVAQGHPPRGRLPTGGMRSQRRADMRAPELHWSPRTVGKRFGPKPGSQTSATATGPT